MFDIETVKAGVELADGWDIYTSIGGLEGLRCGSVYGAMDHPAMHDALAAQLRKQAQSNPHIVFNISVVDSASFVEMLIYNPNGDDEAQPLRFVANEMEESMACIKVIVDSKVLK